MGNRKRYAKFQENLFDYNEIKSIFCPPLFRKRPILSSCAFNTLFVCLDSISNERVHVYQEKSW